jgi:hypothetical protein
METGDRSPMSRHPSKVILICDEGGGRRDAHYDSEHPGLRRRPLEALLAQVRPGKERHVRLRKIAYALAWLAALAMAVGAGWRPF